MTKITKKEMFAQIRNHLTDPQEIEFINHEIELLEKKSTASKKPTANQVENENYMDIILGILEKSDKALSISDIQALNENLPTSNQRMSALLKKLNDAGAVEKVYEKRKPFFKIPN